ncbi:MAG: hypothetical protein PUD39_03220 [Bacteroidales bacterium]|nr:hypothetical protein [Bacteroidales bacterium]
MIHTLIEAAKPLDMCDVMGGRCASLMIGRGSFTRRLSEANFWGHACLQAEARG